MYKTEKDPTFSITLRSEFFKALQLYMKISE